MWLQLYSCTVCKAAHQHCSDVLYCTVQNCTVCYHTVTWGGNMRLHLPPPQTLHCTIHKHIHIHSYIQCFNPTNQELLMKENSYHIVPIFAQKSSFQYRYLEGFKWPMLQNLSLIYIIMKIHDKKINHFKYWKWLIFSHGSSLLSTWGLSLTKTKTLV